MRRVAFLFDGYNLYHSLRPDRGEPGDRGFRWLDLIGLSMSLLHEVGHGAQLESVAYFSALAGHIDAREPGTTNRHNRYIAALRATGVSVELGLFKQKRFHCQVCGALQHRFEEKETDVSLAVRLLELLWTDRCDVVVLVSADSDLAPALRAAQRHLPERPIFVGFPHGRGSAALQSLARRVFRLRRERYAAHQLPDPVVTPDGRLIRKPSGW